tara:strand:- start:324 stop:602 length:279 start_codon:yes stop_codon:yes gene_type:complete
MSKQISKLMKKYPQIFYGVSYEGNEDGGGGTWVFMNPSWYSPRAETGQIHEYTIRDVLSEARGIWQDKERWIEEHPEDIEDIGLVLSGAYDK